MTTGAERLADLRAIAHSATLETQLDRDAGLSPMIAVLVKARDQAVSAMNSLVYADASNADLIRGYQNEVRRYDDLVAWCQEIFHEGIEADARISEADRSEFSNLIMTPEVAAEARALGVHTRDYDA